MIKIYQVAYKNLLRKKTRTSLTILGIALSAWVLVSLLGFNRGYQEALNRDIDNMGFQVLVTAKGCPYEAATLMLKGGTGLRYIDQGVTDTIAANPKVQEITPMLMQAVFDPNKGESGGITAYLGIDPATYPRMKSYLVFKEGKWFTNPDSNEAVLGYEAAELEQREVGDKLLIPEKEVELTVVGILARTGTQDDGTIFVPVKALQRIFGMEGRLTGVGVKVNKEADISKVEDELYDLPDVQVISLAQVKQTIMSLIATAKMMVLSIAIIAILIAVLGVVNTVVMSVLERYQEIGILKSMGATPWDIFRLIWIETVVLCFIGGAVGVALALALSAGTELLIRRLLPYVPTGSVVVVDSGLAMLAVGIIIGVGILSGVYPAWRAAAVKPLESIRSAEE